MCIRDRIGGEEYTLLLTTKATKEIAGRYGGLENLGEKLMKSENLEMAIGEIVWLITLLANQSILGFNLKNKENPKELLTEEMVELLTAPADLAGYKTAITEALYKGTKRNIESETDTKNAQVGYCLLYTSKARQIGTRSRCRSTSHLW